MINVFNTFFYMIYISGVRSGHASHALHDQQTLRDDLLHSDFVTKAEKPEIDSKRRPDS